MEIKVNLNKNFVAAINRLSKKYSEKVMGLNNLSNEKLNNSEFIDRFTTDNVKLVDLSSNPTSNMARKDIVTMRQSMSEPQQKLLCFNKMFYEITKKYGRDEANKWLEDTLNGALYMHDSDTCTFMPYCWAVSLQPVAEQGLFFVDQFKTDPPQHLSTFCDHVLETVGYLSNRQSGE